MRQTTDLVRELPRVGRYSDFQNTFPGNYYKTKQLIFLTFLFFLWFFQLMTKYQSMFWCFNFFSRERHVNFFITVGIIISSWYDLIDHFHLFKAISSWFQCNGRVLYSYVASYTLQTDLYKCKRMNGVQLKPLLLAPLLHGRILLDDPERFPSGFDINKWRFPVAGWENSDKVLCSNSQFIIKSFMSTKMI